MAKIVLGLDPGTKTGWAYGPAGQRPESGSFTLKRPKEHYREAVKQMGIMLRIEFIEERRIPDIVAYEEPMGVVAWKRLCERIGRPQNPESLELQHHLAGAIEGIFGNYEGVQLFAVRRQTVVKHFTGKSNWGGREKGKNEVLGRAQLLGLLPVGCRDDDRGDAVANHDWASNTVAKATPKELVMFGEAPPPEEELRW